MQLPQPTLRTKIVLGTVCLIIGANIAVFVAMFQTSADVIRRDLLARQTMSIQLLGKTVQKALPDLQFIDEDGTLLDRALWPSVPQQIDPAIIDTVGNLTGETATIFRWDSDAGDFLRVMTNIIKPDGTRAVGTYLGVDNPVHATILSGQTYKGEAIILGKPYLTVYQPVFGTNGDITGILYVGVHRTALDAAYRDLAVRALIVSAVCMALGIVIAMVGAKWMLGPLRRLSDEIRVMASGDLDRAIPGAGRPDEIGSIASSMEDFRRKLIAAREAEADTEKRREDQNFVIDTLGRSLEKLSRKDLTVNLGASIDSFPADYENLRQRFEKMVVGLAEAMSTVRDTAEQTSGASDELAGAAQDLSTKVAEQAAALEQSAAAVQMMSDSSQDIARRASEANDMSEQSRQRASQGADLLKQAVEAMGDIVQSSQAITDIINVIDDIAFQTNILALNAGVEAQRSGTHGKGFSVVALEVGSLAQRVATSAQDIKTLVAQSRRQVDTGSELINRTSNAIYDALEQTDRVDQSLSEIAAAVGNQSSGLSELSTGISSLDQATQRSAIIAKELTDAGAILVTEAQRLLSTIGEFELPSPAKRSDASEETSESRAA